MQVYNTAQGLAGFLGKETCISQDRPGFIVNRVLMPMINEAFYTLMEVSPSCALDILPPKAVHMGVHSHWMYDCGLRQIPAW